jgi:beta-mannosidase
VYEADAFYDACDELGLLVWQDFLFACGIYPAHEAFLESVRAEAQAAVERLRHHPCLALWCGNNEDYSLAAHLDLPVSGEVGEPFPARAIYEELLPEICGRLDPSRPYWPGSPYGGDDTTGGDAREGDQHVWEIWNGAMAPYQEYPRYSGRFVSEFGMIGLPSAATIRRMASPVERYPGSRVLDFHLKAGEGVRRLAVYLAENVRIPADMDGYSYATQLVQAEALATALRSWRRRFGGPGAYGCGGALVWQLNDCWPVISWSILDDALFPKMGYYAVSRGLAPLALEMQRHPSSGSVVWAANHTGLIVSGRLQVRRWTLSGQVDGMVESDVVLAPHRTTELGQIDLAVDSEHALDAELSVEGGTRVRASLWAEPLKYLTVSDPGLMWEPSGEGKIRLTCRTPAKGVWVESEANFTWSDNGFDLFPGAPYEIEAGAFSGNLCGDSRDSLRLRSLFDLQSDS